MQIMIELPDKVLARIRSRHGHCENVKYGNGIWTDDLLTVSTAIYFGKVLPKGHGRLIDVDKMIDDFKGSKAISLAERFKIANIVEHQQTIIGADEEVEE